MPSKAVMKSAKPKDKQAEKQSVKEYMKAKNEEMALKFKPKSKK